MNAPLLNGQVAVIGAGTMGIGIAQVAAAAGHPVRLFDIAPAAAQRAIDDPLAACASGSTTARPTLRPPKPCWRASNAPTRSSSWPTARW